MISILLFLFGLTVGSFLNVCIHRLPRGESVVRPRSRCPNCQAPIAAYDNIPLISYLLLQGRCRHCHAHIAWFYPVVELATATLLLALYSGYGFSPLALKYAVLALALLVLIVTDLRDRILPDRLTYPVLIAGLLLALWVPVGDGTTERLARLLVVEFPWRLLSLGDALLGGAVWAGVLYGVGAAFYRVRKVEGLGFGDVKMVGLLGVYFGLKLTLVAVLLACVLGILLGGGYMLLRGKDARYELPFGSFLGLASLAAVFWGPALLRWYLGLLTVQFVG
ncbi:MAG: prepilin peptidase [Acidobacteria bacterium]|nr:prepilin peptidase [Acidobacteriota bacterium]